MSVSYTFDTRDDLVRYLQEHASRNRVSEGRATGKDRVAHCYMAAGLEQAIHIVSNSFVKEFPTP